MADRHAFNLPDIVRRGEVCALRDTSSLVDYSGELALTWFFRSGAPSKQARASWISG